jgi:hypothetical protein
VRLSIEAPLILSGATALAPEPPPPVLVYERGEDCGVVERERERRWPAGRPSPWPSPACRRSLIANPGAHAARAPPGHQRSRRSPTICTIQPFAGDHQHSGRAISMAR